METRTLKYESRSKYRIDYESIYMLKKFVFFLIYYNDNTLCFINLCWLYENVKKGYLEALSILCNAHLHRE